MTSAPCFRLSTFRICMSSRPILRAGRRRGGSRPGRTGVGPRSLTSDRAAPSPLRESSAALRHRSWERGVEVHLLAIDTVPDDPLANTLGHALRDPTALRRVATVPASYGPAAPRALRILATHHPIWEPS